MATNYKYKPLKTKKWSYGAELELVDWPQDEPLWPGQALDQAEYGLVNSNGVAVDSTGKFYHKGGEILTAPSLDPTGPSDQLCGINNRWPEAVPNYRCGTHIHVRVPGLREDLKKLKRLQAFIHEFMPILLPEIDPLPAQAVPFCGGKEFDLLFSEKKNRTRYQHNHHFLLPRFRLDLQQNARTPVEFFEAEAIHIPTRKVYWATTLRACINLRQLLQTDTIEFRHFAGTCSPFELLNATLWCKRFLEIAFCSGTGEDAAQVVRRDLTVRDAGFWPKLRDFDPWLEQGYVYTSRKHNAANVIPGRIVAWLAKSKKTERPCVQIQARLD